MTGMLLSPARRCPSSRNGSDGVQCLDAAAIWRKSSHSGGDHTDCVEVTSLPTRRLVAVRDSKNPEGPVLAFALPAWSTFLNLIKTGHLGQPMS